MKQPARIDTRTSLEKLGGLLDVGRQQFGGLLGAIPVVGQIEAIERGLRAAGQGNMTGVAEAAADVIPAGRIATRGIRALTKGKSTGQLSDVMNIEKPKYQGSHAAPDKEFGAPLNDISRDMYPADVYSAKGLQYYGSNSPGERESLDVARRVRGNPDAMVTVYRAVPKGAQTDINAGDWITPSKEYAKYHAENVLKGQQGQDYEILSKKVPAKHVYTDANSLAEYGYDPTGLGIQGGLLGSGTDSTQLNRFETEADRRMEIARRNAALPVEQGGLGLPEDNTPMERAKAMGFDVDAYHGTKQDIQGSLKPGYADGLNFVTPNSEFANNWIGKGKLQTRIGAEAEEKKIQDDFSSLRRSMMDFDSLNKMPAGPEFNAAYDNAYAKVKDVAIRENSFPGNQFGNVLPLRVAPQKTFDPSRDYGDIEPYINQANMGGASDMYKRGDYIVYENPDVVQYLKGKGYDSMMLRESSDGGMDTLAMFNPEQIRSRFAAFDPMRRNEADLLALQGSQQSINLPNFERLLGLLEDSQ